MKFGQSLNAYNATHPLLASTVPMIEYKSLKKQMKRLPTTDTSTIPTRLTEQCQAVESTFVTCYKSLCAKNKGAAVETRYSDVTARNLLLYVRINAVAVRKCIKKYVKCINKREKGESGSVEDERGRFMQMFESVGSDQDTDTNEPEQGDAASVDVESVDVCVEGMSEALSRASTLMVELRDQHRFKFLRLDDYHVQELVAMSLLEDLVTKDVDSEGRTLLEVYTAKPLRGRTRSGSADSAEMNERAGQETAGQDAPLIDLHSKLFKEHPEMDAAADTSLDCCICFEPFFRPVALTCGHRFCGPCIEGYLRSEDENVTHDRFMAAVNGALDITTRCPVCRCEGKVSKKMHVLTVLCREKYPEQYKERTKELEDDFKDLMKKYNGMPVCGAGAFGCRTS